MTEPHTLHAGTLVTAALIALGVGTLAGLVAAAVSMFGNRRTAAPKIEREGVVLEVREASERMRRGNGFMTI